MPSPKRTYLPLPNGQWWGTGEYPCPASADKFTMFGIQPPIPAFEAVMWLAAWARGGTPTPPDADALETLGLAFDKALIAIVSGSEGDPRKDLLRELGFQGVGKGASSPAEEQRDLWRRSAQVGAVLHAMHSEKITEAEAIRAVAVQFPELGQENALKAAMAAYREHCATGDEGRPMSVEDQSAQANKLILLHEQRVALSNR